ncbi:helix-turn-helix domain-containing protein [Sphingobacterium athyrii]|uniref:HTH araC/xylS-type domain-containing protein n=1 Tax=Sphingobacterium athyrii TaxID=2152717 RepID=A0A363NUY4_9SPHI|nr:hypothetical protein [Sphingobacterium athyrii]PUV24528.1 hypothetical protein DCO56_14395 [Sphingobacterium athyrii]
MLFEPATTQNTGHLAKVLKEVTGKTTVELINDAILFEAKVLLSTSELSISQIASELDFMEQSILGIFLKGTQGLLLANTEILM